MKVLTDTVALVPGQYTYNNPLHFTLTVEVTAEERKRIMSSWESVKVRPDTLTLTILCERAVGRFGAGPRPVTVRFSDDYAQEQTRDWLGLNRLSDYKDVRKRVMALASAYWAQFKATDSENVAMNLGTYDDCIEVSLNQYGSGDRFWVKFKNLPYSGYLMDGNFEVTFTGDKFEKRYGSGTIAHTVRKSSDKFAGHIEQHQQRAIVEYMLPALLRKVAALDKQVRAAKLKALKRGVTAAEEQVEQSTSELEEAKEKLEAARKALQAFQR